MTMLRRAITDVARVGIALSLAVLVIGTLALLTR
jgi:uncharacterized membrane protein